MNDWTLLIDYGTSFSRAAIVYGGGESDGKKAARTSHGGRVELVELDGEQALPSGVLVESGGRLLTGPAARERARSAPERYDRAPARWLSGPAIRLGRSDVEPVAAVAAALDRWRAGASAAAGRRPPSGVRLVCPARWDGARRALLLEAAERAGLGSPPLAAGPELVDDAVVTALRLRDLGRLPAGSLVALLDLGGGSAETAVVESTAEGIVLRAVGGVEGIGGEHFDDRLYRQVVAQVREFEPATAQSLWEPPDAHWRQAAEGLLREVRRAKEELSQAYDVELETGGLVEMPLRMTRFGLEGALRPQILRVARELAETITLAGLRPRQLDAVLITGGSAPIPLVARAIHDVIGITAQVFDDDHRLAAVARWIPPAPGERRPPVTVTGRQTGEEAAQAAAEAAAAVATTGSLDRSALALPRKSPQPAGTSPGSSGPGGLPRQGGRRRWPVLVGPALLLLGALALGGAALRGSAVGLGEADSQDSAQLSSALPEGTPSSTAPDLPPTPSATPVAVTPSVAAPYGELQPIADTWTRVVPSSPGRKGSAGQRCTTEESGRGVARVAGADGSIRCTFRNGIRFVIHRYDSEADRTERTAELADGKGVRSGRWKERLPEGDRFGGRLLVSPGKVKGGPWRWWTYDQADEYAMFAQWPGHSAKQLGDWWRVRAPFRR